MFDKGKNNTRTQIASRNITVSFITYFAQILLGFLVRKLFIIHLGIEYLGYNSVFSNILQMLNLADLGIGVAITSYLYKPLAEGNMKSVASLMMIYRKFYSVMGCVVIFAGVIISFFLNKLIPDANCSLFYLCFLFYVNLLGTASTYFLAYKRTLLIADQKSYITNLYDTVLFFLISFLQIIGLIFFPNYILYLILNILKNILSNIILSIKTDKIYGNIKKNYEKEIVAQYKPLIFQYVKDVFVSRIGAVIYYSTDNVILSIVKGSLLTGYLSNYTLITTQLNTIVVQMLNSLQATFGNYISTNPDLSMQRKMTDNYFCVNYCIGNFCMISFILLTQPFVSIFFGQNMLLSFSTVIWLGVNLFLTFLIQLPSQVFVIYRLYKFDKLIIAISAFLNIIISFILVKYIGINGVLIGTFVTSLIYLFSRLFVISKHVYRICFKHYVFKMLKYGIISTLSLITTFELTKNICTDRIMGFFIKTILVLVLSTLITSFMLCFMEEFTFLVNKLIPFKARKCANKLFIGILVLIFSGIAILISSHSSGNRLFLDFQIIKVILEQTHI